MSNDVKRQAIKMAGKSGVKKAAEHFNVPLKSLKRWLQTGKKGQKKI
jgi:transposase-like protein